MKRRLISGFFIAALISFTLLSNTALAVFNPNRIIDDAIFSDFHTMSALSINNFLNSFPGSCISPNSGFLAVNPIGYNPTNGYLYGGNVTAGEVIAHAAEAYETNPQVILATLQKEEGLIRGDGPYGCSTLAISAAVGYGCPDSQTSNNYTGVNLYTRSGTTYTTINGICVNSAQKVGFSQQVIHAAWLFKFGQQRSVGNVNWAIIKNTTKDVSGNPWVSSWDNSDDPQSCYSMRMTQGYRQVCPSGATTYYDGLYGIDGTTVHMDTGATAAFYNYTPHLHGNQNFSDIFTTWFGSTTGPFYQFVSAINPPSQLEFGQAATVQVQLSNTSTQTWYSDGNLLPGTHAFRLIMRAYQNTPFADTTDPAWLGSQNQIRMVEPSVAPGQTATFRFSVRAPNYPINNGELNMLLVQDGMEAYQDLGLQFRVSSVPDYAYSVSSVDVPPGLLPGDMYKTVFKIKNTGIESWYSDSNTSPAHPHPIRLATPYYVNFPYAFPRVDPAWLGTQNQIRMVEPVVAPGQTATFQAILTAPYTQINNYSPNFELVLDGVKFIYGPIIPGTISTPAIVPDYAFVSAANPPSIMHVGQQAVVDIKIKNTGNVIWRNFDYKVLSYDGSKVLLGDTRMITNIPIYGNSLFATSSDSAWLGTQNQIRMFEPVVAPGQTGIFKTTLKAPTTPGNYLQYFTFGIDGSAIMKDLGLAFPVTVVP